LPIIPLKRILTIFTLRVYFGIYGCHYISEASIKGRAFWCWTMEKDGRIRGNITMGDEVLIVLKRDQRTGKLTPGRVKDILTRSESHPHGIKVRLEDGLIGRVQKIVAHKTA